MRVKHVALKISKRKYFYEEFIKAVKIGELSFRNKKITDNVKNIIYNRIIYNNELTDVEDHPEITLDRVWHDKTKWYSEGNLLISTMLPCDEEGYIKNDKDEHLFYIGSISCYVCRWIVEVEPVLIVEKETK